MCTHGGGFTNILSFRGEKTKKKNVYPCKPIFSLYEAGLPWSSLNGLVDGKPWLNKERMKEGRKLTGKKEGRKEGHAANRNWILPVYSVCLLSTPRRIERGY